MADLDEDAIPRLSTAIEDDDLEDEAQDFRFLTKLTASSSSVSQSTIPKRGTKDFEPNPTKSQAQALDASRHAMQTVLSAERVYSEKTHIVGQFIPEEDNSRQNGGRERCVVVYKFKSTHGRIMGQADSHNWVWLLPEEALFLHERGSLDIRWPDLENIEESESKSRSENTTLGEQEKIFDYNPTEVRARRINPNGDDNPKPGELPMSLQAAYACLLGRSGLTLERYLVYAGLKRLGFIVQRASTWDVQHLSSNGHATENSIPSNTAESSHMPNVSQNVTLSAMKRLFSWLFNPRQGQACPSLGPLIAPGLYRNYNDVFRALAMVPYHSVQSPSIANHNSEPDLPFRIAFDVWKPAAKYKKSEPPPPDYRIAVIDARASGVPTMEQIGCLLDSMPEDILPKEKRLENRIKHGRRNVLLAVVDSGVVSYLRVSDAQFGSAKLYEERRSGGMKGKRGRYSGGKGRK